MSDPADEATGTVAAVDAALAATPREGFLPRRQRRSAGEDRPLPIGAGQTNSQPRTVRDMLIALRPASGDRVLDVGAGSGWSTVLLGRLVGPTGQVIGVERIAEIAEWGAANVAAAGLAQTRLLTADPAVLGYPDGGPYDRILVSAQARAVPQELVDQLTDDGLMVIPVAGHLLRVRRAREPEDLGWYSFVPLVEGE